jgi:hypothetical protein
MLEIFEVTAPFFALILCGYLAARLRLLPERSVPALNVFVLYFALPCMLFGFCARTPFGELVNLPVFLAYATAGLAMLALFVLLARFFVGESLRDAVFGGLAAAWSNWGYMGFALLPAILGPAVLPIVIAAGMADLLVVVSATLALDSLVQRPGGVAGAVAGALARVARNPLIWAVVAGGAFSAAGLALPRVPGEFARLLGEAAVPVALFTIGVSLYRPGTRWEWTEVLVIAGAKLVVHPLLAVLVAAHLYRLSSLEVATLALAASLPVAGTVFLFAERAGANGERIAAAILVSTALAFFTFSSLGWVLASGAPR